MVDSPSKGKPSRKPIFTAQNVQRVLPLVSAGVELLGTYAPAQPYARIVRTVATAAACTGGGNVSRQDISLLIEKLIDIRRQVVLAEKAKDVEALSTLRIHQDIYTDFLLDKLQGS